MVKKMSAREAYENFSIKSEMADSMETTPYISEIPAKRNETFLSLSITSVLFLVVMWTGLLNGLEYVATFWMFNFSMNIVVAVLIKLKVKFWHLQWWRTTFRVIYYRGKAFSHTVRHKKGALLGAAVLIFCNITPLCIECIFEPALQAYMRTNQYGFDKLATSDAGVDPDGDPTFLFLQETETVDLVSEDNYWITGYYYNEDLMWSHPFTANGSSYLIAEMEGFQNFTINLVYSDLVRQEVMIDQGETYVPLLFASVPTEYDIEIKDIFKEYLTLLVIQPLYLNFWENQTLDFSTDEAGGNPSGPDNRITSADTDNDIFTRTFYGYGQVALYICTPLPVSYSSIYIEVDGSVIQHLQPFNDDNYLSNEFVAEQTNSGNSKRYDIQLNDLNLNQEFLAEHTLRIAICRGENNLIEALSENTWVEFAIVSLPDFDWDRDGLTTDQEINTFVDFALSPAMPNTFAYYTILPESNSYNVFESDWSYANIHIIYNGFYQDYLYIDFCSNLSAYMNFSLNGLPILNGGLEGMPFYFREDGWYSLFTGMILVPNQEYDLKFCYNTYSEIPKDSLVLIINSEIIPILDIGEPKLLSEDFADSDFDGLLNSEDRSPFASWEVDPRKMIRLLTDIDDTSDSEIHLQIKAPQENLYTMTHNSTGIFYEWNNEAIVSITPALRLFYDYSQDYSYAPINIQQNVDGIPVDIHMGGESNSYTTLNKMTFSEFIAYWYDINYEYFEDSDGDGLPNNWEVQYNFDPDDPKDADDPTEFDLVYHNYPYVEYLTALDEYRHGTDPNDDDTDNDGQTDFDEMYHLQNPLNPVNFVDSDGDGMSNTFENTFSISSPTEDPDNDGLTNLEEFCVSWTFEDWTSPIDSDSDNDGLLDGAEIDIGYDPFELDSNSDGRTDYQEFIEFFNVLDATSNPNTLQNYDLMILHDSAPSDWDSDGLVESSSYDDVYTFEEWFDIYVDLYSQSNDAGYFNQTVVSKAWERFCQHRGASNFGGEIIDLSGGSQSFEGSLFVPANHISKEDGILDLKMQLLWKVMDLNIFDEIITEFSKTGGGDVDREYTDVLDYDSESDTLTLRTRHWDKIGGYWILDSGKTVVTEVSFTNESIWFPTTQEVDDLLADNTLIDSYDDWAYYADSWSEDTSVDSSLLGLRFGNYNSKKDLTIGTLLPPGTKIYKRGEPQLMQLYPWDNEQHALIQSIELIEHESIDYLLYATQTEEQHTLLSNIIKNPELWDLESSAFDPMEGGIDIDYIYGPQKVIKSTTQLQLMDKVSEDFESETEFGMGWGQERFSFSEIHNLIYEDIFDYTGDNYNCYTAWDDKERVLGMGLVQDNYAVNGIITPCTGEFTYGIGEMVPSGIIELNCAMIDGLMYIKLLDDEDVVCFEMRGDLNQATTWEIKDIVYNQWESTGIEIDTEGFQRIRILFNTGPMIATVYINDEQAQYNGDPQFPIYGAPDGISSVIFGFDDAVVLMDECLLPAWCQIGAASKVLYSNSIYSTRDLTKDLISNNYANMYCGNFFTFNDVDYYLHYSPDTYLYDLYQVGDRQFLDTFGNIPLDLTTFNFNQDWMDQTLPAYFTFNQEEQPASPSTVVHDDMLHIHDDNTEGTTDLISYFSAFTNGSVSSKIKFDTTVPSGSVFSIDVLNFSTYNDYGELVVTPLAGSVQLGIVDGYFAYKVEDSQWYSTTLAPVVDTWYGFEFTFENDTSNTEWEVTLKIGLGGQTLTLVSTNPTPTITLEEGDALGSLSFYSSSNPISVDDLAISTMRAVYNDFGIFCGENKPYDANLAHTVTITDFMNNINYTLSPSMMMHDTSVSREIPSIDSGVLDFNLGVTNRFDDITVFFCHEDLHYVKLYNFEGYWHFYSEFITTTKNYNLSIPVFENEMHNWKFIFGDNPLFGDSSNRVAIFYDSMFLGEFYLGVQDLGPLTDFHFSVGNDQYAFIDYISLNEADFTPCTDTVNNFEFEGYWHDQLPTSFILNDMEFEQSLYWTGEFAFPNGTVFAYLDKYHQPHIIDENLGEFMWVDQIWSETITIKVAKYKLPDDTWAYGQKVYELMWANSSSCNYAINKYIKSTTIGLSGARIVDLNSTDIILNEYTEISDWCAEVSKSIYDCHDIFDPKYNIVISHSNMVIKIPKSDGISWDIISDISATSYKLNGLEQTNQDLSESVFKDLPLGTIISFRSEADDIAYLFLQGIATLIDGQPEFSKFEWNNNKQTVCLFEVNQFETNLSDPYSYIKSLDSVDVELLYSIDIKRDYDDNTDSIIPIKYTNINLIPTSIGIDAQIVINNTDALLPENERQLPYSRSHIFSFRIDVEYAVPVSPFCHIAPTSSNRLDLSQLERVSEYRSPYVIYYDECIISYIDYIAESILDYGESDRIMIKIDNLWQIQPIGDWLFISGSAPPIASLKIILDMLLSMNLVQQYEYNHIIEQIYVVESLMVEWNNIGKVNSMLILGDNIDYPKCSVYLNEWVRLESNSYIHPGEIDVISPNWPGYRAGKTKAHAFDGYLIDKNKLLNIHPDCYTNELYAYAGHQVTAATTDNPIIQEYARKLINMQGDYVTSLTSSKILNIKQYGKLEFHDSNMNVLVVSSARYGGIDKVKIDYERHHIIEGASIDDWFASVVCPAPVGGNGIFDIIEYDWFTFEYDPTIADYRVRILGETQDFLDELSMMINRFLDMTGHFITIDDDISTLLHGKRFWGGSYPLQSPSLDAAFVDDLVIRIREALDPNFVSQSHNRGWRYFRIGNLDTADKVRAALRKWIALSRITDPNNKAWKGLSLGEADAQYRWSSDSGSINEHTVWKKDIINMYRFASANRVIYRMVKENIVELDTPFTFSCTVPITGMIGLIVPENGFITTTLKDLFYKKINGRHFLVIDGSQGNSHCFEIMQNRKGNWEALSNSFSGRKEPGTIDNRIELVILRNLQDVLSKGYGNLEGIIDACDELLSNYLGPMRVRANSKYVFEWTGASTFDISYVNTLLRIKKAVKRHSDFMNDFFDHLRLDRYYPPSNKPQTESKGCAACYVPHGQTEYDDLVYCLTEASVYSAYPDNWKPIEQLSSSEACSRSMKKQKAAQTTRYAAGMTDVSIDVSMVKGYYNEVMNKLSLMGILDQYMESFGIYNKLFPESIASKASDPASNVQLFKQFKSLIEDSMVYKSQIEVKIKELVKQSVNEGISDNNIEELRKMARALEENCLNYKAKLNPVEVELNTKIKALKEDYPIELFSNIMFDIIFEILDVVKLTQLLYTGGMDTGEYINALAQSLFWFAFDIGLEALDTLSVFAEVSKLWSIVGRIAGILEWIVMFIRIGIMVYYACTTPWMAKISNYRMDNNNDSIRKRGGANVHDKIKIAETYYNLDEALQRSHIIRVSARTSRMPMNTSNIGLTSDPDYSQWYQAKRDVYCPDFDFIHPYEYHPYCDIELNIPLDTLTRNEEIYIHHIFGGWDPILQVPPPVQFKDIIDIGAVTERKLSDFIENMHFSTPLTEDSDSDGLTFNQEIAKGTNGRLSDSDGDKLSDSEEVVNGADGYITNPMNPDTDGDLLPDYNETSIDFTDPTKEDTDGDALSDYCEVLFGTLSSEPDTDFDGLPDVFEFYRGTLGNEDDSDGDGLTDLTEIRLAYNPRDNDDPVTISPQTALAENAPGFYKGTHTFNGMAVTSDPWYSSGGGAFGEAYISAEVEINEDAHSFVYLFNQSARRIVGAEAYMQNSWTVESYIGIEEDLDLGSDESIMLELRISDGHFFAMRYCEEESEFQYRFGTFYAWETFADVLSSDVTCWSVWSITWNAAADQITFSVDLDADETVDYYYNLGDTECPYLDSAFGGGQRVNYIVIETYDSMNVPEQTENIFAIDSLSIDTGYFSEYTVGELYDTVEIPDFFATLNNDTMSVTVEWAPLDDMKFGVFYTNVSDLIDIYSQNTFYQGPATSIMEISLPRDGTWWFKPCAIFSGIDEFDEPYSYFFPMDGMFSLDVDTYSATYDLRDDTLGEAPEIFTVVGPENEFGDLTTTVEETFDITNWYSANPFSGIYRYILMNDTFTDSQCSIEKQVNLLIDDGDFYEFWWKTNDSNLESKFYFTDGNDLESFAFRMEKGYFWMDECNTSIIAWNNTWYQIRLTISKSGWWELFINGNFIDNYQVEAGIGIKEFGFATSLEKAEYELWIKGIGVSRYGYTKYENWPEMKFSTLREDTIGFGATNKPYYNNIQETWFASGSDVVYNDFIFLSDTVFLVNTGKVFEISGSSITLSSTIRPWSSAKVRYGKLYIMSEDHTGTDGHEGLTIYSISNPSSPVLIGDPIQNTEGDYDWDRYYGPAFEIFQYPTDQHIYTFILIETDVNGDYKTPSSALKIYDVSDPANLAEQVYSAKLVVSDYYYAQDIYISPESEYLEGFDPIGNPDPQDPDPYSIGVKILCLQDSSSDVDFIIQQDIVSISSMGVWSAIEEAVLESPPEGYPEYNDWLTEPIVLEHMGTSSQFDDISEIKFAARMYADSIITGELTGDYLIITTSEATLAQSQAHIPKVRSIVNSLDQRKSYTIDITRGNCDFLIGISYLSFNICPDLENHLIYAIGRAGFAVYSADYPMTIDPHPLQYFPIYGWEMKSGAVQCRNGDIFSLEVIYDPTDEINIAVWCQKEQGYLPEINELVNSAPVLSKYPAAPNYLGRDSVLSPCQASNPYSSNPYSLTNKSIPRSESGWFSFLLYIDDNCHFNWIIRDTALDLATSADSFEYMWFEAAYTEEEEDCTPLINVACYRSDEPVQFGVEPVNWPNEINQQYLSFIPNQWNVVFVSWRADISTGISTLTISCGEASMTFPMQAGGFLSSFEIFESWGIYIDRYQECTFGTDSDGDGITDLDEIFQWETNPFAIDSDGDGIPDGWEIEHDLPYNDPANLYPDPFIDNDFDMDDLNDLEEYQEGTDPRDMDSDRDGSIDGVEVKVRFTNPLFDEDGDSDNDEILDIEEQFYHMNPNCNDQDGDLLLDNDELEWDTDPMCMDTDGDQIDDGYEANDFNNGLLDPTIDDADDDVDGDKISNINEYFGSPTHHSRTWAGDSENTDSNGGTEHLPDDWEIYYWNSLSQSDTADDDEDKLTNYEEYCGEYGGNTEWGLDPTDSDWTGSISNDYCTYYSINYADPLMPTSDYDVDKLSCAQEFDGYYGTGSSSALHPNDPDPEYPNQGYWHDGLAPDWCAYYDITYDQTGANADPDQDKLKNAQEFAGLHSQFTTSVNLHPRENQLSENFVYVEPDGDRITYRWMNDWRRYWDFTSFDQYHDQDGDKVLDWQEQKGRYDTETTWGLNPRAAGDWNPTIGMSQDWAAYWGFTYDISETTGALWDADGDKLMNKDEYAHGTNPRDADSDGDGLPDGFEGKYDATSGNPPIDYLKPLMPVSHGTGSTTTYDFSADTNGAEPAGWTVWDGDDTDMNGNEVLDMPMDAEYGVIAVEGAYQGRTKVAMSKIHIQTGVPIGETCGVYLQKTFPNALDKDGNYIEWKLAYDFLPNEGHYSNMILYQSSSAKLTLKLETGGALKIGTETLATLSEATWYTIRVVLQPAAGMMKILLNDVLVKTYTVAFTSISSFRSSLYNDAAVGSGSTFSYSYLDDVKLFNGKNDYVLDDDSDEVLNWQEWRFDSTNLDMNPRDSDSDDDNHPDRKEWLLYWQYASGSGIKHVSGSGQVSPIVKNEAAIYIEKNDATGASCSCFGPYVVGSGSFLDSADSRDGNYGWNWAYSGYLNHHFSGYSAPYGITNLTVAELITSVVIYYKLRPYTTDRNNQQLSNFKLTIRDSQDTSQVIYIYEGALSYAQKNEWKDLYVTSSTMLNSAQDGYQVDDIFVQLDVNAQWFFQSGQINTDYLGVRYTW